MSLIVQGQIDDVIGATPAGLEARAFGEHQAARVPRWQ